jgi:hypothetical protein
MRAAKAAGRQTAQNSVRESAALGEHLSALKLSRRAKAGGVDVAHFWWAQLPKSHRNAEGLRLVRARQAKELEELSSGRALEGLNRREAALKAEAAAARNGQEGARPIHDVLQDLEDVRVLKTDLPQRIDDVSKSIARLDRLIAHPPKLEERRIGALRALAADRRETLVAAGVLDSERAAQREGLVSRWVGLEPTGEEIFVGHRLGKVRGARPSLMPVSVGTGRVRVPEGVARENKLALAKSGRVAAGFDTAIEDWQAAKVYKTNLRVRSDLAEMGRPLEGTRVPEDHVLVNPKGRPVPKGWKLPAELADGGFNPDEIEHAARELVDAFYADSPHAIEAMQAEARATGLWPELRVLPKDVAERYFKQFTPGARGGAILSTYDRLVDLTAASIIFARVGYIPKNIVQNVIMAVPHQGAYLLANAVRAGQVLRDPALRARVLAEVGYSGATRAVGKEARTQKVVGKLVGFVGAAADDPLRVSAFLHEASAAGVIPRTKPVMGEKDRAKLLALFENPANRSLLNDIRSRSVEAMADFSRLTPAQRKNARRLLIIPGWLMAGTRYPFHFAATHPIRSALLAYVAMGEPGAPERLKLNPPIDSFFEGKGYLQGIKTPWGRERTGSLSPVNTPWELGGALVQTARGKEPFGQEDTAFDYANPLGAATVRFAQGEGVGSLKRLAPNVSLAEDLISPEASPHYPEDASRLGRLERELGIVPIDVRRTEDEFSPVQRARQRVLDERNQAWAEAQRVGLLEPGQHFGKPILDAWKLQARRAAAYREAGVVASSKLSGRPYQLAAFAEDIKLALAIGAVSDEQATQALSRAQTLNEDAISEWRQLINEEAFGGSTLSWLRSQIREAGGEL